MVALHRRLVRAKQLIRLYRGLHKAHKVCLHEQKRNLLRQLRHVPRAHQHGSDLSLSSFSDSTLTSTSSGSTSSSSSDEWSSILGYEWSTDCSASSSDMETNSDFETRSESSTINGPHRGFDSDLEVLQWDADDEGDDGDEDWEPEEDNEDILKPGAG